MAHPVTEATNAPAPVSVDEKAADFENFLFGDEEEDGAPEGEEPTEDVGDELEDVEEQEDEDVEPLAAIDPPVSLNAEEKDAFLAASPEAQQAWAASETRRNVQVQEATTKASQAQRVAEQRAAQADAEAKLHYAQQLNEVGKAYRPIEPDRRAYRDDVSYLTACRAYDGQLAQHNEFMQQVQSMQVNANQEAEAALVAQRDRELMAIPEVSNPETREAFIDKAMSAVDALGYDKAELARSMTAQDVRNLAQIADWRAKAERFDQANTRQMQKVRAAKGKNLRPNAAAQNVSAARATHDWQRVKSAKSKDAQAEAFADYMGL